LAHRLTNVPGSSAYFCGGVVAYSNRLKVALLGVPEAMLAADGAVSEAVAAAMARGARERLGSDWAVAVTGIAGPQGGTLEKPVGLVYIATVGGGAPRVTRNRFHGARLSIKEQTAEQALLQLLEHIEG
jgi:PncC family amidohydrolase